MGLWSRTHPMNDLRKLLVAGVNELLERKLISLDFDGDDGRNPEESGHAFVRIFGEPSVVNWHNIGFGELRISVWWRYDLSEHPRGNSSTNNEEQYKASRPLSKSKHYPKFVGVCVSGWLERKKSAYLQGQDKKGLHDVYIRKGERVELAALPTIEANGFQPEGKFHL